MRMSSLVLVTLCAATASLAQAKTDVELTFSLLEYSDTTTKLKSDDLNHDTKETDLITAEPSFDLGIYADGMSLRFDIDASDDSESGGILVGFGINDKLYAGPAILIENKKSTDTTKPDGGSKSETKEESNSMAIGPFIHYRAKEAKQMIEAQAVLAQYNSKTKETSDSGTAETEDTTETKIMALTIGGNYRKLVWERVYFGAGLAYTMSLSGDSSSDDGTNTTDYDVDLNEIDLTLCDMLVEF